MSQNQDYFESAGDKLPAILAELDVPETVEAVAQILADVVGGIDVDWAGDRSPNVVATSCIHVADYMVRRGDRYTVGELTDMAPGSHPTVLSYYHDIPQVFFEHAGSRKLRDLDEIVLEERENGDDVSALDVLRVFRDAERAGIGMAHIDSDPWPEPGPMRDLSQSLEEVQP